MSNFEFKGFTPETIQFLQNLSENNYKEWFEANRDVYEKELLNPFKELILSLSPSMYNIDSGFELRPHRVMSRIYRDTRFSKNKEPYKTCLWMTFQQPIQDWQDYPGYFFELRPDGYTYGMGLYMAKKKVMDRVRENIQYNAAEFRKIVNATVNDRDFSVLGEEYKRPLINDLPEWFQPWMQKKSTWVAKTLPVGDELYTPEFAETLRADFIALEWLYNFFKESVSE